MNIAGAFFAAILIFCVCLFLVVILLGHGIPGVTHTLQTYSVLTAGDRPSISPDSSTIAYTIAAAYEHFPVGIAQQPDGGSPLVFGGNLDLYAFDLRARGEPTRLFSRNTVDVERSMCAWMTEGLYVYYTDRSGPHYFIVNPKTKSSRSLTRATGEQAFRDYDALTAYSAYDWRMKRHAEFDSEHLHLYYWHPETMSKELLYALPGTYRGYPIER